MALRGRRGALGGFRLLPPGKKHFWTPELPLKRQTSVSLGLFLLSFNRIPTTVTEPASLRGLAGS